MSGLLGSPAGSEDPTKIEILKESLYDACAAAGSTNRVFTQADFMNFDIIPDGNINTLMRVVQELSNEKLFKPVGDGRGGVNWKYRSQEDAHKYKGLQTQEQSLVYELIDEAGADGIWSRTLKARLGLHESVLKQCLKHLESKGYIRDMKSVEHPNKKMYIKAGLMPSEKATGGPWYTDSNLDEAFIEQLQKIIFDFIKNRSTYLSTHGGGGATKQPKNGVVKGSADSASGTTASRKRTADAISTADAKPTPSPAPASRPSRRHHHHHHHREHLLPMPAGYVGYPTNRQVAEFIEHSGITNNTTLGETDVQQLVDVLVYDGVVEPVRNPETRDMCYRVVKAARLEPASFAKTFGRDDDLEPPKPMGAPLADNGYTGTPCGQCPVFDLCEEGGPVRPSNCVYFSKWLGLE
ncbi:uncharacterized protein E0L32_000361 [Thyridium curvatum]|uniref:DNA-directed RNA polymerase III subunit RPC6 n=1 Tax=Thyridium curvatum TaxID=1093900 RepID=A0A507B883_9PEZI|nr:uncharacterized protein E0L32_000361 [Thyridium curvatum]TPX16027.1 hypothetical protein E0L32_000361 [Thyridium curvatum]